MFEALWPKRRDKIRLIKSHIERHTSLLRNETRIEHIREEHKARHAALDHFERTEKSHQRQEYHAIKASISPRMYEDDLYNILGRICHGTGKWLLRDDIFTKWLNTSDNSVKFLWLQGIPGAGMLNITNTYLFNSCSLT